jgi:hypothetical protein
MHRIGEIMEKIVAVVFVAAFGVLMLGGCSGLRGADPLPTGSLSQATDDGASGGGGGGAGGGY